MWDFWPYIGLRVTNHHRLGWLTTAMYSLTDLEARSLKSVPATWVLPEALREICSILFLSFW
jgi:hypothetical protein